MVERSVEKLVKNCYAFYWGGNVYRQGRPEVLSAKDISYLKWTISPKSCIKIGQSVSRRVLGVVFTSVLVSV